MRGRIIAGVFVGGSSSRMGGRPKGLLTADGTTLVDRWRALFDSLDVPVVLVGANDAYAPRAWLPDEIPGIGPLGGLAALLRRAGDGDAVAVACDMPRVSVELLRRLVDGPPGSALAARRDGRWEPMFARYPGSAREVVLRRAHAGELSLQGLLDELDAGVLALSGDEARQLLDWDTPEDIEGGPR